VENASDSCTESSDVKVEMVRCRWNLGDAGIDILVGDDIYRERAALLHELKAACQLQARLYQELSDLAATQAAYSRYLIQTRARRPSLRLHRATAQFVADFRQRTQAIQADLAMIHQEIQRIQARLRLLRANGP
jgi:hypothetical protein